MHCENIVVERIVSQKKKRVRGESRVTEKRFEIGMHPDLAQTLKCGRFFLPGITDKMSLIKLHPSTLVFDFCAAEGSADTQERLTIHNIADTTLAFKVFFSTLVALWQHN